MGDLSKDFSRAEFACHCGCGFDTVDAELLAVLQELRNWFKRPVTVNSSCRCKEHNRAIGGSLNSQHVKGRAADVEVEGVPAESVHRYLEAKNPERFGLGKYASFTHIDTRTDGPARWEG